MWCDCRERGVGEYVGVEVRRGGLSCCFGSADLAGGCAMWREAVERGESVSFKSNRRADMMRSRLWRCGLWTFFSCLVSCVTRLPDPWNKAAGAAKEPRVYRVV
ncbi:hypothetical protein BU16DRAFT_257938 [Lophium mytilinum]|uniref:Uncharacterized protein n=1 Tax=Lophium mytilinum TaxID=390894 RepID=A0A6A6R8N6_9PEZI|nr:hypothetical protein BU16DRAFT_257938 [Lophium mytilinum]